ncbi:glycosyltransferase family 4 protein [Roseibium aquae]|uniref:glycosyltransferase family 4 protein n=1 Tax=Roseibium aquae TaxID=1323746 RepID=UPI00123D9A77|nr:glycosyltransferase family 4 protein [Roseibium aquae]
MRDFLSSTLDHIRGRPKRALPTMYHYVGVLTDDLSELGVTVRRAGKHILKLSHGETGHTAFLVVRYTTDTDLTLLQEVAGRGHRIGYLIDDDMWAMVADTDLSEDYRNRVRHFLDTHVTRLMPLIGTVYAPSHQILARMSDKACVKLDPAHLSPVSDLDHFAKPDPVRIVFLGTSTHRSDFRGVLPGVRAALEADQALHLTTLLGKSGEALIPSGPQVRHIGDMFFPRFQTWLSRQRFHIGLAPYAPNPVNDGRSNLKFHQHAMVGAAGIYTRTAPFVEAVRHEATGLLVDHAPEAVQAAIASLAADRNRMRDLAKAQISRSRELGDHATLARLLCGTLGLLQE